MTPLISIIVPIYNAEKYLEECIESILNQTYRNIQLILVNDGSTDNSLSICLHYKQNDSRVLIINKLNAGVSEARNSGLNAAQGEYIGFVDSDDYIDKNMYEVMLNRIIEDNTDLCALTPYTCRKVNFNNIEKRGKVLVSSDALNELLLLKFPTSVWAYLYTKNSINKNCMNRNIHMFEDFEFNFNILFEAKTISLCNLKLYKHRNNESSINNQEINNNIMTSLDIYDLIYVKCDKIKILQQKAIFFRANCLVGIILRLSKTRSMVEKYYIVAREQAKKKFFFTMFSQYVPLRYKIAIISFLFFPKVTINIMYYAKYYR